MGHPAVGPPDDLSYDCDESTIGGQDGNVLLAQNQVPQGPANIATLHKPQQQQNPPKKFWPTYLAQLSCQNAVVIADLGNMDDQGGIYAPTLALAAAIGGKSPFAYVTGAVVFSALVVETVADAREKCTSVWGQ